MALNTYLSILTLDVNGLNAPIKIHRVVELIKNSNNTNHLHAAYKRPLTPQYTYRLKVKRWKNIYQANGSAKKKSKVAIFITDKTDFTTKTKKRQRRALCNREGINSTREHNNCKYLCTQHWST